MASTYFYVLIVVFSAICFNDEVKAACGGYIETTSGVITSPFYPSKYPPNHRCTWEIKLPTNNRIGLHFKHMRLEGCSNDYLLIRSKLENGTIREHGKYCTLPGHTILSESNNLFVEFISDHSVEYEGFELEFFSVYSQCGGTIVDKKGALTSPQYNNTYRPNMSCRWTIEAPLKYSIRLNFETFSLEPQDNCHFDYVTVKSRISDGGFIKYREHGKFCGSNVPPVITSESNVLLIEFVSDRNKEQRGFLALFSIEKGGDLINGEKGNISTPFFPDSYPPNKVCEWTVLVPPKHKLKMRFLHFEIEEGGEDCTNDFLLIQTKTADAGIREYGKYCGESGPGLIYSNDTLLLKFVSDRRFQRKGFKAEYFIDKWSDYEVSKSWKISTTTTSPYTTTQNNETGNFISKERNNLSVDRLLTSKKTFLKEGRKQLL